MNMFQYYEADLSRLGKPFPNDKNSEDSDDDRRPNKKIKTKSPEEKQPISVEVDKNTLMKNEQLHLKSDKKHDKPLLNVAEETSSTSEKTIQLLLAKNGKKYLVKWKNLPETQNSWEHRSDIPTRILNVRAFKQNLLLLITIFLFPVL